MGQKQILTQTQIAKMLGHEKTHFLNPHGKRVSKPLGRLGGLQQLGFQLITLLVGSVASDFQQDVCEEQCVYVIAGYGIARIGPVMLRLKLAIYSLSG